MRIDVAPLNQSEIEIVLQLDEMASRAKGVESRLSSAKLAFFLSWERMSVFLVRSHTLRPLGFLKIIKYRDSTVPHILSHLTLDPDFLSMNIFNRVLSWCEGFAAKNTLLALDYEVPAADADSISYLQRHGFNPYATKALLQAKLVPGMIRPTLPPRFTFSQYRSKLDAHTLALLYNKCFAQTRLFTPVTAEAILKFEDIQRISPLLITILRFEDSPIGFVRVTKEESGAWIESIGIVPEFRGRRLGMPLLQSALAICTDNLLTTDVSLSVDTTNAPAMRLYLTSGFYEVGREVRMRKPLPALSI